MRVLFTCFPAYGHFHPLVPLAEALRDAGHDVAFATAEPFRSRAEQAGFIAIAAGLTEDAAVAKLDRLLPPTSRLTRAEFGRLRARMLFCEAAPAAMLGDLVPLARDWRADLIVHDEGEAAGPIAAAVLGIPSVAHGYGSPLQSTATLQHWGEALTPLWRQAGLEPAPYGGLFNYLFFDPCPPSLQGAHVGALGVTHQLRPVSFDAAGGEALPAWIEELPSRPNVYASLGTVTAFSRAPELWAAILAALAPESVNVIMTVGPLLDPAALGKLPANAHVERYIPQSLLFPRCDVVITHGGAGTLLAALNHGIPMLMLPRGAPTQHAAANAAVAAGVARVLEDAVPNSEAIRHEVRLLLDESRYRVRAQQLKEEIGRMPDLRAGVAALETLVAEHRGHAHGEK